MSEPAGIEIDVEQFSCPLPMADYEHVLLGHGSGGTLTADLIRRVFLQGYGSSPPPALEDQATLALNGAIGNGQKATRIAITTDSFVVRPPFFPGGNIGSLAVHGTVNDLAVGGATPLYMAAAFILEEGLPMDDLRRIVASMREACTKRAFPSSRAIRRWSIAARATRSSSPPRAWESSRGDASFPSAMPGRATRSWYRARWAIMESRSCRSGKGPNSRPCWKAIPHALYDLTRVMLAECPSIRWMRDPTRGGLSRALNEVADASNIGVRLDEAAIPVRPEVHAACAMLGLDPLYVASEGKLVAVVPPRDAEPLLAVMRGHPLGRHAALIGEIIDGHPGRVVLRSSTGGQRVVTMLAGEQLPRIC